MSFHEDQMSFHEDQRPSFRYRLLMLALIATAAVVAACSRDSAEHPHGPIAADISARLGEPLPTATAADLATFERGRQVALRRFGLADGLGPSFNVTFCAACHERPTAGGSAALYRNFFIAGTVLPDGSFVAAQSAGPSGGVIRMYSFAEDAPARPPIQEGINVITQRNPIPFFGVGLLAELSDEEILRRADPDDADGDGISGRANYDRGFVGRFGRKSQTVSIEGFIRGPLFNHLGITTDPLSDDMRARLPVDSSTSSRDAQAFGLLHAFAQAAAPDGPTVDFDGVPDPEMTPDDLFDLIFYSMLLAAPDIEQPTELGRQGAAVFDAIGCGSCHTPRLEGPRGPLPVYSDLLLHDMGEELADGLRQGEATGSEFRTQPLWGLAATGPYLHDGRAGTIREAILAHAGEGQAAADRTAALTADEYAALEEFLLSLGGRSQHSLGLIPPDEPIAAVGTLGGPLRELSTDETALFLAGRAVFDRDGTFSEGIGTPGFNGDSCRACHFDPIPGGSGPAGVNVMRNGTIDDGGVFHAPAAGTILHKETARRSWLNPPDPATNVFEHRQTPTLFGLGLIDAISDAVIAANADPDDLDGDGISGRVAVLADGRIGKFGWKAQVPSLAEFVRDAAAAELGFTMAPVAGLTFGITSDDDDVPDPEFSAADAERLLFFLTTLAPPPRRGDLTDPRIVRGETVFHMLGCAVCHTPTLEGPTGPVALYSDLLLHAILPEGAPGIADGPASMQEFRTPPLWGLRDTGPYLHTGAADTVTEAILGHDGEAAAVRARFQALGAEDLQALLAFLDSL